jgi:hypothetical protein
MLARTTLTLAGCLAMCAGANAQLAATPIALSGHDDALGPGQGPGVHFGQGINGTLLSAVSCINLAGDVVFRAANDAPSTLEGVWRHSAGGANTPLALTGWQAGPVYYGASGFNFPLINNSGHTAWRYSTTMLVGDNGSGPALMASTAAVLGLFAPGTNGATWSGFSFPAPLMNASGDNAFIGSLTVNTGDPLVTITPAATANSYGVWSGPPESLSLRIRQNDLYPGSAPEDDLRIGQLGTSLNYPSFNSAGQILVPGGVQGSVNSTNGSRNDGALFKYTPGSGVSVVARRGDAAPGSSAEFYNGIALQTNADMNNAGKVVFSTSLRNAAVGGTQTIGFALFTDTGGALTMAARGGSPMPAILGANGDEYVGVNWGGFSSYNLINHSGTVLFDNFGMTGAGVTSGNSAGLFTMDSSGTFRKVMRMGDPAPAFSTTGGPVTFNGLQGAPTLNALGQVVFSSLLASPDGGVNGLTGNNLGLFAVDARGVIYLLAQSATGFQVAPGDVRTTGVRNAGLGGFTSSGGEDGRSTSLSDNGQVVFSLAFTDGSSGVFVATIPNCGSADFDCDGDVGTDADIEAFFACLAGNCPASPCRNSADFNADGDVGTDADIEAFFRVLAGGSC